MKLITKVVALEATKLLLTVIIVVFGIYGLRGIGDNLRAISHSDIPLMVSISKITAAQIEQSLWLQKVVLETEFGDANAAEEASLKYGELSDQVTAEITQVVQFVKAILEKENNELDRNKFQQLLASLRKIESDYDNYTNIAIRLLVLIRQNDEAALKAQLPEAQILVESMSNDLQKLNASIARSTEIRALGAEQDESVATNTMIFVSLIALALALVLGIFIARNISKRFGCDPTKLEHMAALVAEGRLEIERDAKAEGVYGAISRTVENLTKIIRGIKAGAKEVSAAAEQVFQGNLNLSQRTQEQASSLEQVAASMEQMIGTTNQNADNALQASSLADSAREIADKGKKIVDDTVAAMDIINDSSGQIANIIGVIEELAFQTNLLALNATVEAARAGESGRGFAVVAAEVKSLAGRSAKASNDIKTLIKSSVEKVIDGTKMAGLSGDALSEIVAAVDNVSKIVKEIAAASQEQSQGIGQVNKALMQMDEMTQQNAALVEQASATSEAMGAQAEKLSDLVSYFKINNDSVTYTGAIKRITINEQERSSGYKKQPVSRFAEVTSKTSTAEFSDDDSRWTEF